jgi:endonuclease YncB( thermonuclease family)
MTGLCVLAGETCKISLRLKGIDCPEMRGRGPAEKEAATCVRDAVRACCLDKICAVTPHGVDKYGRLLVDVATPDHGDLASLLLRHKLGRPYGGATRSPFSAEEISCILREAKSLQHRNL